MRNPPVFFLFSSKGQKSKIFSEKTLSKWRDLSKNQHGMSVLPQNQMMLLKVSLSWATLDMAESENFPIMSERECSILTLCSLSNTGLIVFQQQQQQHQPVVVAAAAATTALAWPAAAAAAVTSWRCSDRRSLLVVEVNALCELSWFFSQRDCQKHLSWLRCTAILDGRRDS